MTDHEQLVDEMTERARGLCALLGDPVRFSMDDDARRSWTYLPGERPGVALVDMDRAGAKAALRLLATGLRPHAYAQAATIMALEDVLDEAETGAADRHRGDYWAAVFGTPGEPPWGWRLGGHHLSVSWTVEGDGAARATPQFLGANPARVEHGGALVLAPLAWEEDVAVALVEALDPAQRRAAVLPGDVPRDILTGDAATVDAELEPAGLALADLGGGAAELAGQLLDLYRDRLPGGLPPGAADEARFAWVGGTRIGEPRYYRIQGRSLVVELDNTQNGANHIHSVVRDRRGDFGGDVLREHRATAH